MIVTLVNGSPRSGGATGKVLKAAAAYLAAKPGVETRFLDLAKTSFEPCRGCQHCYRSAGCIIERDGLEQAADMLRTSDGIIIGSPTYGSNITGILKNFLDRGHFIMEQALQGKHGLSVSTYEIADGRQVNRILNKFLLVAGASRNGSVLFRTGFGADPLASPARRRYLERRLERFYRTVRRGSRKSLFERLFTDWLLIRVIWKPFLLARPQQYAGVLEQWKSAGYVKNIK